LKHVPAHFDRTRKYLEDSGYPCIGITLPGNSGEPHIEGRLVGIEEDLAAVRNTIVAELGPGKNVVVVSHSYGSIPGTAALANLSIDARRAAGKPGGVQAAAIISGFVLPAGTSMLEVMGGALPPQYWHENDTTLPFAGPGAIQVLYNDLDTNDALKAVWQLKPQSYGVNTSKVPDQVAGLKGIPLSYLLCGKDNAVPLPMQEATVNGLKAAGCDVTAEVVESGHSPFINFAEETAKFIRKAAGENVETGLRSYP
jgi:pimeloyl-ACP methyl ester carboxylesterase